MRNDACVALAILLTFSAAAHPAPGSWFDPSPCDADSRPVPPAPGERVLLAVHFQPDAPPRDTVLFMGTDGFWRVPLAEWRLWTPAPPQVETAADGTTLAILKSGAALALRWDSCASELWVDANPNRHQEMRLRPAASRPVARAGFGGFANLDFNYGGFGGTHSVESLLDFGIFGPGGAGRSDFFVANDVVRRLDSYWVHDDPADAIRLRLGDSITHAADWETPARFGGLQWGTDFSLQPARITFPLPSIAGSAGLPSTAQLYVNGVQQSQQPLQPGQFRFDSVPTLTGAGDLSVVVRDSLGRQQTVTQPFYTSPRLLEAGLETHTVELGFLRENYASPDDQYTRLFVATTLQRGFTSVLTGLFRASASDRRQLAGLEGDAVWSHYGVFTLSAAASHTEGGGGGIGSIGFERQANDLSLSLIRRAATREYGDLGRDPGTVHFSDSARLSLNMHRLGIGSVIYVAERPWSNYANGSGVRLGGLAWNLQPATAVSAYASVLHTIGGSGGNSIAIGVSVALGAGTSGSIQWNRDPQGSGGNFSLQHSPPERLGWSYAAQANTAPDGVREAQAVLTTERGSFGGGWAGIGGNGAPSVVVDTALAFLDGHAYWTRPVQNSFAVVDAGDAPGVSVYRENQLIGTTNSQGRLLVPDLLPFSVNRLSIDDSALPVATGLTATDEEVAPPANAGVPVHFKVDGRPKLRLRLMRETGEAVPAGAVLWLDGREQPLPVGYDGLVYADIADGKHVLDARWADGACRVRLVIPGGPTGTATCTAVRR